MSSTSRLIVLLTAFALGASGCHMVPFHEKRHLSDPALAFDDDPGETHFFQKVYYSREGSAGGIGSSAGGGCGCY